ncbi:SpaA isopeptide-forming pilin-related protein [Enterococcus faecalis]|uniref:SpaA isopeptide-forming pilin-related protein n=1 Tax=Enterococcus faecalis TaxID=1351 RepID=UPI0009B3CAFF|nr:SpaA isopeptide-forming pilin-related protein [Enterococcus faecalis]
MKKRIYKVVYMLASLVMVIGQLGIAQVFAETVSPDDSSARETKVYHDYEEYQKALKQYNEDYAQYEQDLDEYNQKKQEHDDAQAEADRVEKENAEKKAEYEQALEQYQKDLDEYNNKQQEVDDHSAKGQYIGPNVYSTYAQLESYLVNYAAMIQMSNSGLSLNGESLISTIKGNMAADPFTGSSEIESNVQGVIDQWNIYAEFEKSIYGTTPPMNISGVTPGAINGAWYDGFKGVDFYHTFNSTTGKTEDNVPSILDHPTEDGIKQALTDLFTKTNGAAFDAANQQMDNDTFMVDQSMVNKWSSALEEAKNQGLSLYATAIQQYTEAFETYNSSNYETADFNAFMGAIDNATETQKKAMNLIGGMNGVELEDGDNSAPFYNDLRNLSASDLANKYGYLKLLSNMASEATYGYFHLLTPEPGEVISVATASSWSNAYSTFGRSQSDYTPKLTPPTEPTPPTYETVPVVPDEPVVPTPPVKPVYEPLNSVSLLKVDKETKEPLANAKFELENIDNKEVLGTFTTGNDGLLEINDLNPGTYILTEIESPEGYVLDNTPVSFIIHGTENEKIQLEKSNISTTGSVELTKVDEKTNTALQGAVFEIRDSNGSIVRSALQTNLEGKILVDGLKSGEYSFVETKAPTGYVLDNTPIKFTIEKDQQEVVKVSIKNKLMPGGVVLSKTDAKTGEALQGAVFELQDKDGKALQSGLITDNSGKLAIDGLEPGNYQLVETKAPTGYDLDQTPVKFAIEKGQTEAVQVSMTNKLTPGGVVLSKTDAKTGEALQGAVFELQDKDGKTLQSGLVTDESGKLAVDGLEPGEYQLVETQAPTGYDLDATPVTFTIEKGQTEAAQVSMTNKLTPGGVVLSKTDAKTGEALQGAVFELQDKDGKTLQSGLVTDESGKLAVDGLEPGEYQLVETQAPTGYDLDATPVTFTIEKGQTEAAQVSMTNKLTPGGVVLSKTDAKTGEALQGAVFELQDKDGKTLQSGLVTDESGKLAVDGLEPGEYRLVETQAPTGYDLDATPVTFTIEKGQLEAVQVTKTNQPTVGSVVLTKIDSKTRDKLAGAAFELRDSNNKVVLKDLVTDSNGKLAINDLKPGEYQLVETQAPTGYVLDATPIEFVVKSDKSSQENLTKTNKGQEKSVRIEKRDSRTNELLSGAKFKLLDSKGKTIKEEITTDKNGIATIEGLEEGSYQLIETQAPTGYILDKTAIRFTIEKDSSLITLTKLNTKKTDPTDSDKANNPSNSGQSSSTYSPKSYPKTGEKSSVWITVIGVIIVVLIGIAWFVKKRR